MDTLYYYGRRLVYVDRGDEHLVVDSQWERYLGARTKVPRVVRCFDRAQEVVAELSGDRDTPHTQHPVVSVVLGDEVRPAARLLADERWDGVRLT